VPGIFCSHPKQARFAEGGEQKRPEWRIAPQGFY